MGSALTPDTHFGDVATTYATEVVAGKIIACKWHRLACQRHLTDLGRIGKDGFPYVWNPVLQNKAGRDYRPAERICKFAQLMPHIKGDWAAAGQLIKLEPWQVFVLASIFGWVHVRTGKRRFRGADIIVPRKNAKSTLAAVIGLYMLGPDEEFGAEIYSGATSQDQAMEVFRPAMLMAKATPRYCQQYGVTVNVSNLSIGENNSKFEPVIGKPGDGASPSCAIVDEYHEHKTAELFDTMKTGMGARPMAALDDFCAPLSRVCPCASCLTFSSWLPLTALSVVVALSTSLALDVAEVARPLPAMFLATVWNFASADCNCPRPENLAWSRARLALSLTTPVFCDCIWRSTFAYTSAEILPCVVCCVLLV